MTRYVILALLVALVGCEESPISTVPDQCLRAELFKGCLTALPAGPAATKYNDWSEVVDSCASAAYYQSMRQKSNVALECRP